MAMLDYVMDNWSSQFQLYISDIMVMNFISIEEFGVPGENYRPPTRNGQHILHKGVASTPHYVSYGLVSV